MHLLLALGCALHVESAGIVRPSGASVWIEGYRGDRTALVLGEESAPIRYLDGCVVEVTGTRTPAGLVVESWHVRDAGDGSGGFVGLLRVYGSRLVIDDRNTGTTLVVDDTQVPQLRVWAGRPVLLVGTVVGAREVRVMAFRVLTEDGVQP